ncbi:hypothetical protein RJT34_07302 [Clitoria ternatea]|uniref:BED-type domain-containing protein n=1 Tax=Clitoria ternatea TaxID=43366 RepID=A0AAN9K6G5_CLITE
MPQAIEGTVIPTNTAPTAVCGGRSQPPNEPMLATEAVRPDPSLPLPNNTKKRKQNASSTRKRSMVWDHFEKLVEKGLPMAKCNYCSKSYHYDPKVHGTSNLIAHLKVCPKYPYAVTNDPNQSVINFEGGGIIAADTRFNFEACKRAVAIFVILDEHPFIVVEGLGFKHLCKQLQPQFDPPSRHTVAKDCFQVYLDEKIRLKALFKSDCHRVALTTDCWTSVQNLNYLTLTAHFIDNEWKYQKRIISFSVIPNHKGDTVGRKIEEVLKEWGIRNVCTITVDNASSNDVAVSYLRNRIRNMGGLVMDGQFFHMRCCAHILNLVVNDGLKDMHYSITNVRAAVRFVRSSPQRLALFKDCIQFSRILSKKLVCLDVPTRWNSTYLMLYAAEGFQAVFEKLEHKDLTYSDFFGTAGPPTSTDWENVKAFMHFLKIFYEATKIFSTSVDVSLHVAFHQLTSIYCEIKESVMNLNTVLAIMGFEMKKKYAKYWGNVSNMNRLLYFGVVFDPRYKLGFVEWTFEDIYSDQPGVAQKLSGDVKSSMFEMYTWYKSVHDEQNRTIENCSNTQDVGSCEASAYVEKPHYLARRDAYKRLLKEKDTIDKKNELERISRNFRRSWIHNGWSCISFTATALIDGPVAYDVLINFSHTVVPGDDPLIWVSSEDDPEKWHLQHLILPSQAMANKPYKNCTILTKWYTYGVIINGMCEFGDTSDAISCLLKMEERDCKLDVTA